MAFIEVNGVVIEFPDNLSPDQLNQAVSSAAQQMGGQPQERGAVGNAWEALGEPERVSRQGLQAATDLIPQPPPEVMAKMTGNPIVDFARGGREATLIGAKAGMQALTDVAPTFISAPSLLTGGVLGGVKLAGKLATSPLGRAVGGKVADVAEGISGLEYKTPGVLKEAAKDASLFTGPGTDDISPLYKKLVESGRIRPSFARSTDAKSLVDEALAAVDDGSLTPEEGLIARQTLDGIKRSIPKYAFSQMRETFDTIAKKATAGMDAAFRKSVMSDALRTPFPVNKGGGSSIMKGALGAVSKTLPFMSPMVQGATATGIGAISRAAANSKPFTVGSAIGASLDRMRKKK